MKTPIQKEVVLRGRVMRAIITGYGYDGENMRHRLYIDLPFAKNPDLQEVGAMGKWLGKKVRVRMAVKKK